MRVTDKWGVWEEETIKEAAIDEEGKTLVEAVKVRVLLEPSAAWQASIPSPPEPSAQEKARERAITAIKTNAPQSPWGQILYDQAIAQGWIEG